MSTKHSTAPQYRTICRIGYWLHVDAMWNTQVEDNGLTVNYVHLNLADGWGRRIGVGFSIITTDTATGVVVTDEDGETFPDLETAIRSLAERSLDIEWQWTGWQDSPPEHRSAGTGDATETAFTGRDIAHAIELATERAA